MATDSSAPACKPGMTDEEYRRILTPDQYRVTRQKGTERPWSSELNSVKAPGDFRCVCCGELLFTYDTKFESGCGWPSFFKPASEGVIAEHMDTTHGMVRTEVTCKKCGAHLGHVFDDGPVDKTGLRYCINGVSLKYEKK